MSTYPERVRDSMLGAGIASTEDLARRCHLTPERVREVLADPEHAQVWEMADVCDALGVRVMWLVRGWGIPTPPRVRTAEESAMMAAFNSLPKAKAEGVLRLLRTMARRWQ